MRRLGTWTLAFAALVGLASPARSDDKPKMVPEEGAVQLMLLRQQSVREELKLTADETAKIHDFVDRQWMKAQEIHNHLDPAEHRAKYEQLTKENEAFLDKILEPAERKRLDEITLQVAGLMWVTRAPISTALGLTEDQKDKARLLQQEARKETLELVHSITAERRQEKLQELRMTSRKRLNDILTDEQEAKWKVMTGEPFKGKLAFDDLADQEKTK